MKGLRHPGSETHHRILFLGAGSAAIGLASLIASALGQQGIPAEVARQPIRMVDTQGVVVTGRPGLPDHKKPQAKDLPPSQPFDHTGLESECPRIVEAIDDFNPTALIGVSTVGKLFNQEVVEAKARHKAQPIIFSFSNTTVKMECLAPEAYQQTKGTAVFAGGVQLPPVHLDGHTYLPSQANNLYIFTAVGLAILATNA